MNSTPTFVPCPHCYEGSGKPLRHRGRHAKHPATVRARANARRRVNFLLYFFYYCELIDVTIIFCCCCRPAQPDPDVMQPDPDVMLFDDDQEHWFDD